MSEQEYTLMDSEGNQVGEGDLITWWVYDSDDFVTWQFVGVYEKSKDEVLYLGGGIDFGTALGERMPVREVMEQAENNDDYRRGIKVIGSRSCVAKRLLATDDYATLQAERERWLRAELAAIKAQEPVNRAHVMDALLMWNRLHEHPPINVGYEYGVAEAVMAMIDSSPSENQQLPTVK